MTGFTIKIIALLTMIVDHIGFLFGILPLRYIGRIAFPVYAFLIGEGVRHSSNVGKYLMRLLLFAALSEIPFDMMRLSARGRLGIIDMSGQNVFFTLFLGAVSLAVYFWAKRKYISATAQLFGLAAMLLAGSAAQLIRSDYGFMGVLLIAAPVIISEAFEAEKMRKYVQIAITALCLALLYSGGGGFMAATLVSLIFLMIYSGRRGPSLKWAFYIAYPAHMIGLVLIWLYL